MSLELQAVKNRFGLMDVICEDIVIGQVFFNGSCWQFRIRGESLYAPYGFETGYEAGIGLLNELYHLDEGVVC